MSKIGDIDRLPGFEPEEPIESNGGADEVEYDDTSVPLQEVIRDVMGVGGSSEGEVVGDRETYITQGGVEASGECGYLRPADDIEYVWAFDDNGERLGPHSNFNSGCA